MTVLMLHAGCVAIGGRGLLILGESGTGKSDLALRLIDRGARLVSDDYTEITADHGRLIARSPQRLVGGIEARGIGILPLDPLPFADLSLALDLDRAPERMPVLETMMLEGIELPRLPFTPFEMSAPLKAEYALARFGI